MSPATPTSVFIALLLAGLLGMIGQGVRVLAGMKKMNDDASGQSASSADVFVAARLVVSLLIGFVAGVAAVLALGLSRILAIGAGDVDLLLGIAAAGYAGTDFIEAFVPTITGKTLPKLVQGQGPSAQQQSLAAQAVSGAPLFQPAIVGVPNAKYGVVFDSLVPNGFFSADPDDYSVHRSIRTNNPGALNFSSWQKRRLGFVAITQPDNSPDHNITTIYRTPEHGVAAWYHLLAVLYAFPGGMLTLQELAARYAGGNPAAIQAYINGWSHWLNPPVAHSTPISVNDPNAMLTLAKAMFAHEAGSATPLRDDQIAFAIERERAGNLPA
jgi:hypothetical protein